MENVLFLPIFRKHIMRISSRLCILRKSSYLPVQKKTKRQIHSSGKDDGNLNHKKRSTLYVHVSIAAVSVRTNIHKVMTWQLELHCLTVVVPNIYTVCKGKPYFSPLMNSAYDFNLYIKGNCSWRFHWVSFIYRFDCFFFDISLKLY